MRCSPKRAALKCTRCTKNEKKILRSLMFLAGYSQTQKNCNLKRYCPATTSDSSNWWYRSGRKRAYKVFCSITSKENLISVWIYDTWLPGTSYGNIAKFIFNNDFPYKSLRVNCLNGPWSLKVSLELWDSGFVC